MRNVTLLVTGEAFRKFVSPRLGNNLFPGETRRIRDTRGTAFRLDWPQFDWDAWYGNPEKEIIISVFSEVSQAANSLDGDAFAANLFAIDQEHPEEIYVACAGGGLGWSIVVDTDMGVPCGNDGEPMSNELMVNVGGGYAYFPTNAHDAGKAYHAFADAVEAAGVNLDNVHVSEAILRTNDGQEIGCVKL